MSRKERSKCKLHPEEEVTNFCARDSCFQELCAECIGRHTDDHLMCGTKPQYENIKKAFSITSDRLFQFREHISREKSRIKSLLDGIEHNKREIEIKIKVAKEDCIKVVEHTFCEIEQQFYQHLQNEKKKTGLHNEKRLYEMYDELTNKSIHFSELIVQLDESTNLEEVGRINHEILEKEGLFLHQLEKQISENERFKPQINYRSDCVWQIQNVLKRIISTSFTYPFQNQGMQSTIMRSESTSNAFFDKLKYEQMGRQLKISEGRDPLKSISVNAFNRELILEKNRSRSKNLQPKIKFSSTSS